jgi:hypothetical protein
VFIRQIVVACLAYAAATTAGYAQSADFTCPKAGTAMDLRVSKYTYDGASPSDPLICLTNRNGTAEQRYFNLYMLSNNNNTAAALGPVKAGLSDMLSGRKTTVTFGATASNGYIASETWTFVRKQPLPIGDKSFNTMVFTREITADPRGRSAFHGLYTVWVDPKAGLWLKTDLSNASGQVNYYPQAYTAQSVTQP